MSVNAHEEHFMHVELFGKPALFTNSRVARYSVSPSKSSDSGSAPSPASKRCDCAGPALDECHSIVPKRRGSW